MESITITVKDKAGIEHDIMIPIGIGANDLLGALCEKFGYDKERELALVSEEPPAIISGGRPLSNYALREGARIHFVKEQ